MKEYILYKNNTKEDNQKHMSCASHERVSSKDGQVRAVHLLQRSRRLDLGHLLRQDVDLVADERVEILQVSHFRERRPEARHVDR